MASNVSSSTRIFEFFHCRTTGIPKDFHVGGVTREKAIVGFNDDSRQWKIDLARLTPEELRKREVTVVAYGWSKDTGRADKVFQLNFSQCWRDKLEIQQEWTNKRTEELHASYAPLNMLKVIREALVNHYIHALEKYKETYEWVKDDFESVLVPHSTDEAYRQDLVDADPKAFSSETLAKLLDTRTTISEMEQDSADAIQELKSKEASYLSRHITRITQAKIE